MSKIDIYVQKQEEVVEITATPSVTEVNVIETQNINPAFYDLNDFQNSSLDPYVRSSRSITINGVTQDLSSDLSFVIATGVNWGGIGGSIGDQLDLALALATKQDVLVSGTNIKTINGQSILGSGDITVAGGSGLAIGTTAITSGTVGRILFEGTGNVVQESGNLFWDNTNGRLGIGTSTPTARQHIVGAGATNSTYSLLVTNSAGSMALRVEDNLDVRIGKDIAGVSRVYSLATGASFPAYSWSGNSGSGLYLDGTSTIGLATGGTSRLQIASTGNVGINTTTDAGFRLDVNGTARVQGSLSVTSNIIVSQGAGLFVPFILASDSASFQFSTSFTFGVPSTSVSSSAASGLRSTFLAALTWQQSSGTAEFAAFRATPTLNTTGTYAGIVRGFHYKPTITSLTGATHYAIHTEAGRVRFENLPTSSAGLSSGDLWNNLGVLMIV